MGAGGNVSGYFSPAEIDFAIDKVMGTKQGVASGIGSNFNSVPGDAATPFWTMIQKDGRFFSPTSTKAFLYEKCRMNSLEVSGRPGQFLLWTADMMSEKETTTTLNNGGTQVAALPECEEAFAFSDVTWTYNSVVYPLASFRMRIDNAIDPQTFENSMFQTRFEMTDLIVTLNLTIDFRKNTAAEDGTTVDHRDLYRNSSDSGNQSEVGASGVLSFSGLPNGSDEVTYDFYFAKVQQFGNSLTVPPGGRMLMPITYMASRNVADAADTDNSIYIEKTVV